MLKKIFIISAIIFLIICFLPFKKGVILNFKPVVNFKSDNTKKEANFYDSATRKEYTKENIYSFVEDPDVNKNAPKIIAQSGIAIDLDTNTILFSKNADMEMPVASLVKVMTAILAMEHTDINSKVTISKNAADTGENTMGLLEGETFTVKELLYGLILNSANDASVAIAEKVAGSEDNFTDYMNIKAKLIGANNTLFVGASGLNKKGKKYYSTSTDMARIAAYSLDNHPTLRQIYQTVYLELPYSSNHGLKILENQTNLLTTYPGVKGIKTGYTEESGLCLISYAENDGKKVLVVVLNSTDRKGDAILLLDYAFSRLGVTIEHNLL